MKDEKVVSVTVDELQDVIAELRAGTTIGSREAANSLEALIAAQHPPEPTVPDADWLVGEDRSGNVAFAHRLGNIYRIYARAGTFTTSNPLLDLRNLRALDLSALPGPGDEVVEGMAWYLGDHQWGFAQGFPSDPGGMRRATCIIRKSKGGGDGR